MRLSKSSLIKLFILFSLFFIALNVWITQHSGPVLWVSQLSVEHFGFWSSNLSHGLPIVFGILAFLGISTLLLFNGFLSLVDENGQSLGRKPTLSDLQELGAFAKERLNRVRFPIIMIVIGLEFSVLGALDFFEAKSLAPKTECSPELIVERKCQSGWILLPETVWPGGERVDIAKSSKIFSYVQLDSRWPIFLKKEYYKTTEDYDPFVEVNNQRVEGLIEKLDMSHYLFFKEEGIKTPASEIRVINWQETPGSSSMAASIQFYVGFIFVLIGVISYFRRMKKLSGPKISP